MTTFDTGARLLPQDVDLPSMAGCVLDILTLLRTSDGGEHRTEQSKRLIDTYARGAVLQDRAKPKGDAGREIPGLVTMTSEDRGRLTLRFVTEAMAQRFMRDNDCGVEIDAAPIDVEQASADAVVQYFVEEEGEQDRFEVIGAGLTNGALLYLAAPPIADAADMVLVPRDLLLDAVVEMRAANGQMQGVAECNPEVISELELLASAPQPVLSTAATATPSTDVMVLKKRESALTNRYIGAYCFDDGESAPHTPNEHESALISDAIHGLLNLGRHEQLKSAKRLRERIADVYPEVPNETLESALALWADYVQRTVST